MLLCLYNCLIENNIKPEFKIAVAHVNYNLRGQDSKDDMFFTMDLAEDLGLRIFTKDTKLKNKSNLEEKCRNIRFAYFNEITQARAYNTVALAHILEDRAENIIIKMLKSGSLDSMVQPKYITYIGNRAYIRPILNINKIEIKDALNSIEQTYRTDKSNYENDYLRNKIRNNILPVFDEINEDWRTNTEKLLYALSMDNSYMNDVVDGVIDTHLYNNIFEIEVQEIVEHHRAIINRVIVSAVKRISDHKTYLTQKDINSIVNHILSIYNNNKSGTKILYSDKYIEITAVYKKITIKRAVQEKHIPYNEVKICFKDDITKKYTVYGYNIYLREVFFSDDNNNNYKPALLNGGVKIYFSIDNSITGVRIRSIKNGDRLSIGKGRSKPVNKILSDMKLPEPDRLKCLVIESYDALDKKEIIALLIHKHLLESRISYNNYVKEDTRKKIYECLIYSS